MKNTAQSSGLYYDERLDDKIDAKTIYYGSLGSVNKKHASVYLDRERDGKSEEELAKEYGYNKDSIRVITSNTKRRIKSLPRNSDEYQLIKYLCKI